MPSPPSNSRSSGSRQSRPHLPSPHHNSQAYVPSTFVQSPSEPAQSFPFPFPTPQYNYTPQSTSLSAPNWHRPRATSSYASESSTLAFPEPQLHRATSARARPPSPPPWTSGRDLASPLSTPPALPPRGSPGLQTPSTEVLSE